MSDQSWVAGATARIALALTDPTTGNGADPAALRLRVKAPAGTVTLLTYGVDNALVRDAAGQFHADVVLAAGGTWHWRWEADTPSGVVEDSLPVKKSLVL